MKKLLAIAVILGVSAGAQAAVGFGFGTNFYKPNSSNYQVKTGRNFLVNWSLDNDLQLGVYEEESTTFSTSGTGAAGTLSVNAIQVVKGVVKNVAVGMNIGQGVCGASAPLLDVFGTVNILSGQGEKLSGALKATVAARFSELTLVGGGRADGLNLGLSVEAIF